MADLRRDWEPVGHIGPDDLVDVFILPIAEGAAPWNGQAYGFALVPKGMRTVSAGTASASPVIGMALAFGRSGRACTSPS